jgi:hypothetical protein
MEVYWQPWSEWWMTASGWRCWTAISRAPSTNEVRRCVAMDQPTMRRLKASAWTRGTPQVPRDASWMVPMRLESASSARARWEGTRFSRAQ